MAASANATIRSMDFFHPQHKLTARNYSDASTYLCAACELVVTGAGYRCGECDFNIHKACLGLPDSICLYQKNGREMLTSALTRLDASRSCVMCKEASHAGRYMYLSPPDLFVHPRCVLTVNTDFQPQHFLSKCYYDCDDSAIHPCAACERAVTGLGLRCGELGYRVHPQCVQVNLVSKLPAAAQQGQGPPKKRSSGMSHRTLEQLVHAVHVAPHALKDIVDVVNQVASSSNVVNTLNTVASASSSCTIM